MNICNAQEDKEQTSHSIKWTKGTEAQYEYSYNIALSNKSKLYVIGGDNEGAFETYNLKTDRWSTLPSLPTPRLFIGGALIKNSIYIIGGIDSSMNYSTTVEKYDIDKGEWSKCKGLKNPRSRLAAVSLNGKIFAIGGLAGTNDQNYHNTSIVEQYDPKTDSWVRKADMPTARHGHAAVVIQDKILVVGGYTDEGPTGIVEAYDPTTDKWSSMPEMPTPRGFLGLVAFGNNAYALAGRVPQEKGPVERYNWEEHRWSRLQPMPEWRNRFGCTSIGNKIFIIGGEDHPKSVLLGSIKEK